MKAMKTIRNKAMALSATVLFATTAFAGNTKPVTANDVTSENLTVNYIGEDANYLFFQVELKKGNNKTVSFTVSDLSEGELYSAVISEDKVQTLKIEKRYNQQLDFTITAGKKDYSSSFTVMPTVQLEKL